MPMSFQKEITDYPAGLCRTGIVCVNTRKQSIAALEVLVERESRRLRTVAIKRRHYSLLLVFANALLKEIRFALQTDELHPIEGVRSIVQLRMAQRRQQSVCDELDVFGHLPGIH